MVTGHPSIDGPLQHTVRHHHSHAKRTSVSEYHYTQALHQSISTLRRFYRSLHARQCRSGGYATCPEVIMLIPTLAPQSGAHLIHQREEKLQSKNLCVCEGAVLLKTAAPWQRRNVKGEGERPKSGVGSVFRPYQYNHKTTSRPNEKGGSECCGYAREENKVPGRYQTYEQALCIR